MRFAPYTQSLLEQTARALTKQEPVIRLRDLIPGADGHSYKSTNQRVYIDLAPRLIHNPPRLLETFLHEVAHAALHRATMPTRDPETKPEFASVAAFKHSLPPALRQLREQQEREADALTARWLKGAGADTLLFETRLLAVICMAAINKQFARAS